MSGWSDFVLERRNDITEHLAVFHRNKETEWTKVAKNLKLFVNEHVFPTMRVALEARGWSDAICHGVVWDIMSYIQEEIYFTWGVPHFYEQLIFSYRSGHLPYGWSGKYPDGDLIEY